jgi:hypothetical protein
VPSRFGNRLSFLLGEITWDSDWDTAPRRSGSSPCRTGESGCVGLSGAASLRTQMVAKWCGSGTEGIVCER